MPAPPKPWEKAGATGQSSVALSAPSAAPSSTGSTAATTSSSSPALPPKPANMTASASTATPLNSVAANNTYANRYGTTSAYGTGSAYGGYGSTYGSSYSSPYNRFGGGYGTGYGSYGAGGFGSGFGAYGSPYGGAFPGMQPDMSLTRTMESGTAATFQLLQSFVTAFGGFAQMLESTFMATHSSFFAMIGVAEQLASLRNWLGEALSVFTMIRFVKRLLGRGDDQAQIGGAGHGNGSLSADGFRAFEQSGTTTPVNGQPASNQPRPSKKPLIIFFLTVIGLPWLMTKLVRLMTARQEAEARRLGLPPGAMIPLFDANGQPLPQHLQPPGVDLNLLPQNQQALQEAAVDPSKLTFVRATHAHASNDEFELNFEKNDIVAVLTPKEERADPGWWRGRLRDGRVGWFPSTHVQEIPMNNAKKVVDEKQK